MRFNWYSNLLREKPVNVLLTAAFVNWIMLYCWTAVFSMRIHCGIKILFMFWYFTVLMGELYTFIIFGLIFGYSDFLCITFMIWKCVLWFINAPKPPSLFFKFTLPHMGLLYLQTSFCVYCVFTTNFQYEMFAKGAFCKACVCVCVYTLLMWFQRV